MRKKFKRGSAREAKSIQHKKLTWAEERFGEICEMCHKRCGTVMTSSGSEGGRDSVCGCDD